MQGCPFKRGLFHCTPKPGGRNGWKVGVAELWERVTNMAVCVGYRVRSSSSVTAVMSAAH